MFVILILINNSSTCLSSKIDSEIYINHGLCFEIPKGWMVAKDFADGNDTQVILTDNVSAIRFDLIKLSDQEMNQIIFDHLKRERTIPSNPPYSCDCPWQLIYDLVPWKANGAIGYYYKDSIIKPIDSLQCYGSGIGIKPDGVDQASFYQDCGETSNEYVIAWTRPEYNTEIIGIHALFQGTYKQIPFEWSKVQKNYSMQEPLYEILMTFTRGDKPKTSLADLV